MLICFMSLFVFFAKISHIRPNAKKVSLLRFKSLLTRRVFRVNKTNTLFGGVKNGAFVQAKHCFLGGGAADAFGGVTLQLLQ